MGKIKKLSKELINKIAAGEVVERPSSVVKELIENSIDAAATNIVLEIKQAGKQLISVKDDGEGINFDDRYSVFEQHATSKLNSVDDLFNISNYGFRGEALASIASVSEKAILSSKTKDQEGFKMEYADGELIDGKLDETFNSSGTKIEIFNLFANVPARKKFLKTDATEQKSIIQTFIELALANINIHFELISDDKRMYNLPKTKELIDRVADIFGATTAKSLIPISIDSESYHLQGLIISPESAKKSTDLQIQLINNRSVKDKTIQVAASRAYSSFIHKELKPSYILAIHIDPAKIDVNIHPRKQEVKYENSDEIFRIIYNSIVNTINTYQSKNLIKRRDDADTSGGIERKISEENTFLPDHDDLKAFFNTPNIRNQKDLQQPRTAKNKISRAIEFTSMLLDSNESNADPSTFVKENETLYNARNNSSSYENINPTQFFLTYIAFEFEDNIVFIDQHAAAEKISFEKLLNEYHNGIENRELLIPEIIELQEYDKKILLEKQEEIEITGIRFEDFGPGSIKVTHHPQIIKNFRSDDFFSEVLEDDSKFLDINISNISKLNIPTHVFKYLAITACHGSIRAGQALQKQEMINLIVELENLDFPHQCPHGRPIRFILSKNDLSKSFNRIV